MKFKFNIFFLFVCFVATAQSKQKVSIYLIGDSTVADYTGNYDPGKDYMKSRFPIAGWGQEFQPFFVKDSLNDIKSLKNKHVIIKDKAKGGRSTRTFFQEGRWREVFDNLVPNDYVLMQFGHNDSSEVKQERYVNIEGYKEFLRLYISQTKQKGAFPIILSPVARNYPWKNGRLENVHGDYPKAAEEVANEMNVPFMDLNTISMNFFSKKGEKYVTDNYFMNFGPQLYEAYPNGQKDNTHFQIEGAKAVAALVFTELKKIINNTTN